MAKLVIVPDEEAKNAWKIHTVRILFPFEDHEFASRDEQYVAVCEVDGPECFREEYDTLNDAVEYGEVHVDDTAINA